MKCRFSVGNLEGSFETMNSYREIKDLFAVSTGENEWVFLLESLILNSFGEQVT